MKTAMHISRHLVQLLACCVMALGSAAPALAGNLDLKDVIPVHINELPFYGNVQKTEAMKQADEEFRATAIGKFGTAEKASDQMIDISWRSFEKGKLNEAMRRANEAWLLNSKNYRVYWGMAIIQTFRAPEEEVDALFRKAIEYGGDAARPALKKDYEFHQKQEKHNDSLIGNLKEISVQYQKARKELIAANSH